MTAKNVPHNNGPRRPADVPKSHPSQADIAAAVHKLQLLELAVCGLVVREQCETEHLLPVQELLSEIVDTVEAWMSPPQPASLRRPDDPA